jgi:CheY-like chemotaxis protein
MSGPPKPRVLVAEDDAVVRKICVQALESAGFDVEAVADGQQAFNRVVESDFALLLTDMEMPEMDGLTLLTELRQSPVAPPVIVLTADADIKKAVRAIRLGAYDFITKPFDRDTLLAAVTRCVETARLKKEVEDLRPIQRLVPFFQSILKTLDAPALMQAILSETCRLLEADGGSLLLYDKEQRHLVVKAATGERKTPILGKRIEATERIVGHALETGEIVVVLGPLQKDPRFSALQPHGAIGSSMTAPIIIEKKPLGVFCLHRGDARAFSESDRKVFFLIAQHSALAISNALGHQELRETKELLEHQLAQRTLAFEKAFEELSALRARL